MMYLATIAAIACTYPCVVMGFLIGNDRGVDTPWVAIGILSALFYGMCLCVVILPLYGFDGLVLNGVVL
jgi:hypothetical protein